MLTQAPHPKICSFTQWLAGLWEFASGNTLGASIFVSYGMFWWGFSFIFIPFFGETGSYDGVPGVYAKGGLSPGEMESAVGLFLWIWFGITTIFLIASVRSSVALAVLLFVLDLTFAFLGAFYYYGNPHFQTAGMCGFPKRERETRELTEPCRWRPRYRHGIHRILSCFRFFLHSLYLLLHPSPRFSRRR